MTLPSQSLDHGLSVLNLQGHQLPETPGVYIFKNAQDQVLYVGKAKRLKRRVLSYQRLDQLPHRKQRMVALLAHVDVTLTRTETEALLLESNLIKKYRPPYNILLKDDKSFPYLHIRTDQAYPQLRVYRGNRSEPGLYFGPFPSANMVYETFETLQRVFLIRTCDDSVFQHRRRPCLLYDIKRCSGPCVQKITPPSYAELIEQLQRFFKGGTREIQEALAEAMHQASQRQDYEIAATLRDRIQALTKIQERQIIALQGVQDLHIFGLVCAATTVAINVAFYQAGQHHGSRTYYPQHVDREEPLDEVLSAFMMQFYQNHAPPSTVLTNIQPAYAHLMQEALTLKLGKKVEILQPKQGAKKEVVAMVEANARQALDQRVTESATHRHALTRLQDVMALSDLPKRIEAYDNSHLFGQHAYGVMVVADDQGLMKAGYRKFAITDPDVPSNDDFAMMRHVMARRFKITTTTDTSTWPDVMLIDGGLGQLNAVEAFFATLPPHLPRPRIMGIAKGPKRNAGEETLYLDTGGTLKLEKSDPLLFFLQRLRDEAHRFAITTHRSKRDKKVTTSLLDTIPGIGPKRKKALLHHFGAVQGVRDATVKELAAVEGLNTTLAQSLWDWLHADS